MAANLARAGHDVRVWNRTHERAEAVQGAHAAEDVATAVDGAEAVITILADGGAVEDVAREALPAMRDDAIWLQMSTVGIAATERLAALAEERGVAFVDAPVLGTKQPAEQGELIVLASGPGDARERGAPVFDAVGSKVVELGDAGEGTRLKLVLNAWLMTLVAGLAETVAFAEAIGIDPKLFLETIDGNPVGPQYAQIKGKLMTEREFPPSFTLELARKDVGLVLEAAERHYFAAQLGPAVAHVLDRALERGHGSEDMAAALYAYVDDE
jgi:3-hydroxyisobutyrate dehydrogenase